MMTTVKNIGLYVSKYRGSCVFGNRVCDILESYIYRREKDIDNDIATEILCLAYEEYKLVIQTNKETIDQTATIFLDVAELFLTCEFHVTSDKIVARMYIDMCDLATGVVSHNNENLRALLCNLALTVCCLYENEDDNVLTSLGLFALSALETWIEDPLVAERSVRLLTKVTTQAATTTNNVINTICSKFYGSLFDRISTTGSIFVTTVYESIMSGVKNYTDNLSNLLLYCTAIAATTGIDAHLVDIFAATITVLKKCKQPLLPHADDKMNPYSRFLITATSCAFFAIESVGWAYGQAWNWKDGEKMLITTASFLIQSVIKKICEINDLILQREIIRAICVGLQRGFALLIDAAIIGPRYSSSTECPHLSVMCFASILSTLETVLLQQQQQQCNSKKAVQSTAAAAAAMDTISSQTRVFSVRGISPDYGSALVKNLEKACSSTAVNTFGGMQNMTIPSSLSIGNWLFSSVIRFKDIESVITTMTQYNVILIRLNDDIAKVLAPSDTKWTDDTETILNVLMETCRYFVQYFTNTFLRDVDEQESKKNRMMRRERRGGGNRNIASTIKYVDRFTFNNLVSAMLHFASLFNDDEEEEFMKDFSRTLLSSAYGNERGLFLVESVKKYLQRELTTTTTQNKLYRELCTHMSFNIVQTQMFYGPAIYLGLQDCTASFFAKIINSRHHHHYRQQEQTYSQNEGEVLLPMHTNVSGTTTTASLSSGQQSFWRKTFRSFLNNLSNAIERETLADDNDDDDNSGDNEDERDVVVIQSSSSSNDAEEQRISREEEKEEDDEEEFAFLEKLDKVEDPPIIKLAKFVSDLRFGTSKSVRISVIDNNDDVKEDDNDILLQYLRQNEISSLSAIIWPWRSYICTKLSETIANERGDMKKMLSRIHMFAMCCALGADISEKETSDIDTIFSAVTNALKSILMDTKDCNIYGVGQSLLGILVAFAARFPMQIFTLIYPYREQGLLPFTNEMDRKDGCTISSETAGFAAWVCNLTKDISEKIISILSIVQKQQRGGGDISGNTAETVTNVYSQAIECFLKLCSDAAELLALSTYATEGIHSLMNVRNAIRKVCCDTTLMLNHPLVAQSYLMYIYNKNDLDIIAIKEMVEICSRFVEDRQKLESSWKNTQYISNLAMWSIRTCGIIANKQFTYTDNGGGNAISNRYDVFENTCKQLVEFFKICAPLSTNIVRMDVTEILQPIFTAVRNANNLRSRMVSNQHTESDIIDTIYDLVKSLNDIVQTWVQQTNSTIDGPSAVSTTVITTTDSVVSSTSSNSSGNIHNTAFSMTSPEILKSQRTISQLIIQIQCAQNTIKNR